MVLQVPGRGPRTQEEIEEGVMDLLEDDTEDAPWMVMGTPQWDAATDFYQSVRDYAERSQLPWFVAGMTPILYRWSDETWKRQLAPDVFVAFAPSRPRSSYDSDVEGFPPFVLEIVSPESRRRDQMEKRIAYRRLGAKEYALFTPYVEDRPSQLAGYRRDAAGQFEEWPKDEHGRLWSAVLGLYLVVDGKILRAGTPDGRVLPTYRELATLRDREAAARQEAEAEIGRLRRENAVLRSRISAESTGGKESPELDDR